MNIILGSGQVWFDPEDSAGNLTGERYIAETPGFSLTVANERVQADSSDGPIAERLLDIPVRVTRDATLQVRDIAVDNLALFVIGTASTHTQVNTPVVDERHTVLVGRTYQLGVSTSNPTGVRNVSSVTVNADPDGTPTALTAGTDYELDAALARIKILEGGAVADNDEIGIDYTPASETRDRITSHDLGAQQGALRFIADNTAGPNRDLYIPRLVMAPDGEFAWKSRDTVQQLGFSISIMKRTGWAQLYVDGRAVA